MDLVSQISQLTNKVTEQNELITKLMSRITTLEAKVGIVTDSNDNLTGNNHNESSNGDTSKRARGINLEFIDLYVENKSKAIKVFNIDPAWITGLENDTNIKDISDKNERNKKIATELWKSHYSQPDQKKAAKQAFDKYKQTH